MSGILETLQSGGRLLGDGAMGTMLQEAGLTDGGAPELWNVERPDVVLWGRDAAHVRQNAAARENVRYLPGVALPPSLRVADVTVRLVCGLTITPIITVRLSSIQKATI